MYHNDFKFFIKRDLSETSTCYIYFGSVGELWFFYVLYPLYKILRRTK
jgi:hypothetical protein